MVGVHATGPHVAWSMSGTNCRVDTLRLPRTVDEKQEIHRKLRKSSEAPVAAMAFSVRKSEVDVDDLMDVSLIVPRLFVLRRGRPDCDDEDVVCILRNNGNEN